MSFFMNKTRRCAAYLHVPICDLLTRRTPQIPESSLAPGLPEEMKTPRGSVQKRLDETRKDLTFALILSQSGKTNIPRIAAAHSLCGEQKRDFEALNSDVALTRFEPGSGVIHRSTAGSVAIMLDKLDGHTMLQFITSLSMFLSPVIHLLCQ